MFPYIHCCFSIFLNVLFPLYMHHVVKFSFSQESAGNGDLNTIGF